MKGFFENFLALLVKRLKKVLMILPSVSGRGQAFPAESCCCIPRFAISNFYRRWTPKLENLTLADWAAWYDNFSSKSHMLRNHMRLILMVLHSENRLDKMMMVMSLSRQQTVNHGDVLKLGFKKCEV